MSSKSFKTVRTPPRSLTPDQVTAYVTMGAAPADAKASPKPEKGPTARLSLDIPEDLHSRFKAACARSRLKMTTELLAFIERRTQELEGNHK